MRIAVIDVPADRGGALVKLLNFYSHIKDFGQEHEWHFLVSAPDIKPCEHILVHRAEHTRKSWIKRIWWELVECPKLLNRISPDVILSLQNLLVFYKKAPQVLYVHQSLPFTSMKKFSFLKREECTLAVYQRIIGRLIYLSVRKANHVIVQTQWMKEAVSKRIRKIDNRIAVVPPNLRMPEKLEDPGVIGQRMDAFFYPAGASSYKNHEIVLDALSLLKKAGKRPKVIFTIFGLENPYSMRLKERVYQEELNVQFAGNMSLTEVFNNYRHTALLFPSYIETVGFPLIEARMMQAPVVSARTPFADEAMEGYDKVFWFNAFSSQELAYSMVECLNREFEGTVAEVEKVFQNKYSPKNTWGRLMEIVLSVGGKYESSIYC